jgi:hypothetical protein
MNSVDLFDISMEAATPDGKAKSEREYEIYGTMRDMSALALAERSELQEQWGIPIDKVNGNAASGSVRVRLTTIADKPNYVFTSKVKRDGDNSEVEFDVTEDLFKHFKLFATQGMIKRRYFFPVPDSDTVYEVDVFSQPDGTLCPRVKIDLELTCPDEIDALPDFPFEIDDIVVIPPGRKSSEHLAFVRELYDKHYTMINQFIEPPPVEVPVAAMEDCNASIKKRLIELTQELLGIEGALTANGSDAEASVKFQIQELGMAVTKLGKEENYP